MDCPVFCLVLLSRFFPLMEEIYPFGSLVFDPCAYNIGACGVDPGACNCFINVFSFLLNFDCTTFL